ncbi:hypothetical protein F5B19DRAFT_32788 [Rostrohypoxylon terebratum]|nr:hypothetical protein F5B19DRAFT_32788 [Rostrohypoxylon terebratum]
MEKFSTETLSLVCSLLADEELCQFRLVCKQFAEVGAKFIGTEMSLRMTNDDLCRLYQISAKPQLYSSLQSLHYAPANLLYPANPCEIPRRYLERLFPGTLGTLGPNDDMLCDDETTFNEREKDQLDVMRRQYDQIVFSVSLPKFEQLQHIYLYFGEKGQSNDQPHTDGAGTRHLEVILNVISSIKINSLALYNLDWDFFYRKDDAHLRRLFEPIANLERLELVLHDAHKSQYASGDEADYVRCQNRMHRAVLRKCLGTLKNLCSLTISCGHPFPLWSAFITPLSQIVSPGCNWSNLTSLQLSSVSCEKQDLIKFFQHHRSLRRLCLGNVILRNTSWVPVLAEIRKKLNLTAPCICGTIMGRHEKGEKEFYCCKMPALIDVNRYIERGGDAYPDMACPINEKNASDADTVVVIS